MLRAGATSQAPAYSGSAPSTAMTVIHLLQKSVLMRIAPLSLWACRLQHTVHITEGMCQGSLATPAPSHKGTHLRQHCFSSQQCPPPGIPRAAAAAQRGSCPPSHPRHHHRCCPRPMCHPNPGSAGEGGGARCGRPQRWPRRHCCRSPPRWRRGQCCRDDPDRRRAPRTQAPREASCCCSHFRRPGRRKRMGQAGSLIAAQQASEITIRRSAAVEA